MKTSKANGWVTQGTLALLLWNGAAWAQFQPVNPFTAFQAANQERRAGRVTNAFTQFLAVPGGEFTALEIARENPRGFLAHLETLAKPLSPRARLVRADLLLALGRKEDAANVLRELAAPGVNWTREVPSPDYYPVEPPAAEGEARVSWLLVRGGAQPFTLGPGSHRDNWLLRRLIALDLLGEAAGELARVWEMHRAEARPYVATVARYDSLTGSFTTNRYAYRPVGFNAGGLLFSIDYAYFLKQRGRTNDALAMLLEPLLLLDRDRDPNRTRPVEQVPPGQPAPFPERAVAPWGRQAAPWGGTVGLTRKDFVRLTFGEFRTLGREEEIVAVIQKQVDAGVNRARRVLAQVRLHQGRPDDALALELEFIKRGPFDEPSAAYRRGLVYDSFRKTAEALTAFEPLLAKPLDAVDAPDAEEDVVDHPRLGSGAVFGPMPRSATLTNDLRTRLERLNTALGRPDASTALLLRGFEANDTSLDRLEEVGRLARRLADAGQGAAFTNWARQQAKRSSSTNVRSNLAWHLGEIAAARTNVVTLGADLSNWMRVRDWKARFRQHGEQELHALLEGLAGNPPRVGPAALAHLEWLDLIQRFESEEAIPDLEGLLEFVPERWHLTEAVFPRGHKPPNKTTFAHYVEVAYRLMRYYERFGRLDDLRQLGLRLARGEKPFHEYESNLYFSVGVNDWKTLGNAALALAVQYADTPQYQNELAAALKNSQWGGARAQLERRMGKPNSPAETKRPPPGTGAPPVVPWANVPASVDLYVSANSVLRLACNDRFIFAGQPWGVTVYDVSGQAVARVALGTEVSALAADAHGAWTGTADGVFRLRLEAKGWSVARLGTAGQVLALALRDNELWIGTSAAVQLFDTRSLELRTFLGDEFKVPGKGEFSRFLFDGDFVWVEGGAAGVQRYDRRTSRWSAPIVNEPRSASHLVALVDGELWGWQWVNDAWRSRPCRIDRQTLAITLVPVETRRDERPPMINFPLTYLGKHDGQPAFGGWQQPLVFDPARGVVRPLEVTEGKKPEFADAPQPGVALPSGARVFAGSPDDQSGLLLGFADGRTNYISRLADNRTLPGDAVHTVLFDEAGDWLSTSGGLVRQFATGREVFTRADGLLANETLDAAKVAGKFWFACGWGQAAGGLMMFDPATWVFTSFHRTDGLDSDKLAALAVTPGGKLRVTFQKDVVWLDHNHQERLCPPGEFDPKTSRFTSGGRPGQPPQRRWNEPPGPPCPWLGGHVFKRLEHAGRTWLCGTHGLVVLTPDAPTKAIFANLTVRTNAITDQEKAWREDYRSRSLRLKTKAECLTLMTDPNPLVRAAAAYKAWTSPLLNFARQ